MQIAFFEDKISTHFKPLTLTRPVYDLRIGILTILEKWESALKPDTIGWSISDYLQDLFKSPSLNSSQECYYINSRYLPTPNLIQAINKLDVNTAIYNGDDLVVYLVEKPLDTFDPTSISESQKITIDGETKSIQYLWDLLSLNAFEIKDDINRLKISSNNAPNTDQITQVNKSNIFTSNSATVEPGVILIAEAGPIYIGDNAILEAGTIIKGPAAICKNATTKMRSRIYDGTTIGPHCKVGGEVAASIFHSYSNKAHDGYAGNSIFGQWCNLGADTNTSNLKNNYGYVRIKDWETKQPYKIGFQFFGTVMGDHSKTSINTMLSTGTTCGVSSNIFSSGFPPTYIPSFTWVDGLKNPDYRFEKALEVMKAMMARRKVELTPSYEQMMRHILDESNLLSH